MASPARTWLLRSSGSAETLFRDLFSGPSGGNSALVDRPRYFSLRLAELPVRPAPHAEDLCDATCSP